MLRPDVETTIRTIATSSGISRETADLAIDVLRNGRQSRAFRVKLTQAASMLGVSRVTFWRRVKAGRYPQPIERVGNAAWFNRADIERVSK